MQTKITPAEAGISGRDIEFLRLLGQGLNNSAIAEAMCIELTTVHWRRGRIGARLASATGKRKWRRKELAAWMAANDQGEEHG